MQVNPINPVFLFVFFNTRQTYILLASHAPVATKNALLTRV